MPETSDSSLTPNELSNPNDSNMPPSIPVTANETDGFSSDASSTSSALSTSSVSSEPSNDGAADNQTTDTTASEATDQAEVSSTVHIPSHSLGERPQQRLFLYSTTVSDVGTVRSNNQDSSFAGEHLVAICDGMGGHAGGDTASTIAIRSLAHIEQSGAKNDVASIASMMETSVMAAHDAIVGKAKRERTLAGMGTTVTAVALVEGHWVVTHIGDSRAYLLRDGKIRRMTQDHSYVQHLIDTGRITEAEARNHPQRNVVMRVLGDFDIDPHPDIAVFHAQPGDRWLLCSDGLSGVLEDDTLEQMLASVSDEEECAQQLVAMALKAGSTDNVTAVIADATLALDADSFDLPHQTPLVGGAASSNLEAIADIIKEPVASSPALRLGKQSPAQRAAALTHAENNAKANGGSPDANGQPLSSKSGSSEAGQKQEASASSDPGDTGNVVHVAQPSAVRDEEDNKANMDTGEIPVITKKDGRLSADPNDPEVARAIRREHQRHRKNERRKRNRGRIAVIVAFIVAVAAVLGVGFGAYRWSQTKYYIGTSGGSVAVYQGVNTNLFGAQLSHKVESTDIKLSDLPQSWRDELNQGITVDSFDQAKSHVAMIKKEAKTLDKSKSKDKSTPLPWAEQESSGSSGAGDSNGTNNSSASNDVEPSTPNNSGNESADLNGASPTATSAAAAATQATTVAGIKAASA
ncbi:Stp1/IreP family PP2C-type Ser/Thr phosphatase [Bifidobacterium sp. ESL0682]|uniref:Stp1/IreP family PP2C-type Ser/Thr phosphatase n=1 Tax=Bifidobacterium sp. ESL0682 TaxID=2983212 RepID=UPI0023F728E5|nr:Stp1/IreP family PP2C-type Ser/Thr phosphatase [Bifidobacterium sp. ESL0682]WEV41957.1 Stp1/IreP family PP2C-type Ser/Thr phosphatase [Bifidobacterium sp. ESL0682]